MTQYSVVITPSAERDITESFLWGCETWGVARAIEWVNDIRAAIEEKLAIFPMRCPIAADDDGTGREYRNFFVGRYRIVFHIDGTVVMVLHVTGALSGEDKNDLGVDE